MWARAALAALCGFVSIWGQQHGPHASFDVLKPEAIFEFSVTRLSEGIEIINSAVHKNAISAFPQPYPFMLRNNSQQLCIKRQFCARRQVGGALGRGCIGFWKWTDRTGSCHRYPHQISGALGGCAASIPCDHGNFYAEQLGDAGNGRWVNAYEYVSPVAGFKRDIGILFRALGGNVGIATLHEAKKSKNSLQAPNDYQHASENGDGGIEPPIPTPSERVHAFALGVAATTAMCWLGVWGLVRGRRFLFALGLAAAIVLGQLSMVCLRHGLPWNW